MVSLPRRSSGCLMMHLIERHHLSQNEDRARESERGGSLSCVDRAIVVVFIRSREIERQVVVSYNKTPHVSRDGLAQPVVRRRVRRGGAEGRDRWTGGRITPEGGGGQHSPSPPRGRITPEGGGRRHSPSPPQDHTRRRRRTTQPSPPRGPRAPFALLIITRVDDH